MSAATARFNAIQALSLDIALAEIVPAMQRNGISPLLIKGPIVAGWLFDDPYERFYGDLDLLVDPAAYTAAEAILADHGFHNTTAAMRANEHPPTAHHWLRNRGWPVCVDLHRSVYLIRAEPAETWARLSADSRPHVVGGVEIDAPAPPAHLVILAVHAAKHGPSHPGPLEDLRRAISRVDAQDWQEAGLLAADVQAAGVMRLGLELLDEGRALADRLELADDAPRQARIFARGAPATSMGLEQLFGARGTRARLELLWHELAPSVTSMRRSVPLAQRGLIGLALAYLWRLLWIAAKLPRGAIAWVTANPERKPRRLVRRSRSARSPR